jgi:transposase
MTVARLVRKTLDLKRHKVVSVTEVSGHIVVELDLIRGRLQPCGTCGCFAKVRDRIASRSWCHVPLWGIPCTLRYRPARVTCSSCRKIRVEAIPWSLGKSPIAQPLVVTLATWSRLLAWDVVARLFGVGWSTVSAAVESAVEYGLGRRDLSGVVIIGIDELSRRRRHIYHTNVYDLQQKRLLWSGEGRSIKTLEAFFAFLGPEKAAEIQGVCCDMWAPYADVVRRYAPQATLVFDRFHLVAKLLRAVDQVRASEAKALRASDPKLLAHTRFIFLKNPTNLTQLEKTRLRDLERWNLRTVRAYLLKEMFNRLWSYKRKSFARRYLERWFWWATHSRLKPLRDFAWVMRRHIEGILAWFDLRIDNGAVEAMNNNAKAISHRARGYRTAKAFTTSMLHCMGGLELLQSMHKFA